MQAAMIKGEKRDKGGRTVLGRLRKRGLVPAVIYGHKETPELVALDRHDLELAVQAHARLLKLKLGSEENQFLLKEVQYDHLQKDAMHVDLMRVSADERVKVDVEVQLRGTPRGVKEGGQLLQQQMTITIECPVLEIPDAIILDVENLGIGQAVHVNEMTLPTGVKAISAGSEVVASVVARREEAAAPAAAEGEAAATTEPEVITRGKLEEAGAEGEEKK
jgi:large subunit ribosomal protein L25